MAQRRTDWLDRLAISASALCLIHCLALPLLLAALPALSRVISVPESFHLWVLAFAVPTSVYALWSNRALHGDRYAPSLAALGLLGLGAGVLVAGNHLETAVTVAGSLLLASAHVLNWRRRSHAHAH